MAKEGSKRSEFVQEFNRIAQEAADVAEKRNWWMTVDNDAEVFCHIHGEVAEAAKANRLGDLISGHIPEYTETEEELADVVILIMRYAHAKGLDVAGAIEAKERYNLVRPDSYWGKNSEGIGKCGSIN